MSKIYRLLLLPILALVLSLVVVYAVVPSGGTLTSISNATAPADVAGSHAAIAGNVTEMTVVAFTTTQSWQGYFGNITGTIQLADGSDNVMYNWSLASPEGEIYASVNNSVNWVGTQCYNNTTFTPNLEFYGDTGAGVDTEFEEVLLKGGSNETIFASILEEDMLGFNDASHDFQMLVLEDGHGTDTATRPYYFYVELE
ncbi:MAG: hypothetical protein QT05_C0012G0007 [archaeon GW2011_AR13]|nr:MAG: hypothetical protein QT05_C0012G0007 [archaeon GW2011_AR13]